MESHFNKGKFILLAFLLLLVYLHGYTQNYYAIQGSNYAGSLGIGNNPASIVNTPYKWDLDILSVQVKNATNGVVIENYSLLSDPGKSQYRFREGDYRRFAYTDFNINLLNARYALNRRQAIGAGINLRSYAQLSTGPINFIDTLKTTRDFLDLGNYNRKLYGDFVHSSWLEFFVTWAQTIWDRADRRLNAGITAKISRGLSGAYINVLNGSTTQTVHGNSYAYTMQDVYAEYGYSHNYDTWQKGRSRNQNVRDFLNYSRAGLSLDLGVEYLIKPGVVSSVFDEDDYYDYDWKIGLSLLDIGFNQFQYGRNSRIVTGFQDNIIDTVLDVRFTDISNLQEFNDRLEGIAGNIQQPNGPFKVVNPARLVLNVDRYLFGAWYVNGNASLNLSSLSGSQWRLTELNMLTITPRWETKLWGFYLPVQFNTKEQFWVGGAFKIGPLLLGVHNWANVFAKNKMQNGGGYIALVIRPGKSTTNRLDKRLDCPKVGTKFSKNRLGQKLSCPPN
ncbi:hypothetical protein FAM09_25465 [Niastella caeni]|uniref:Uncharacterized protein n=1 Tax=Niastella caeni TaxID=2569763 RepID=A0A4S8HEL0_9BACT|nr:hypothetical protein [Niastella caeni]THU33500.1 hypothetical protein FAM09_25465 [Niastella caeni]